MDLENKTAHRYAKALLGLAIEKNVLEEVHEDMKGFVELCNQNREFELMLKSPIVSHYKKYSILESLLKEKVHPVSFTIFEIITRKNREEVLKQVAESFHLQYNEYKNIQVAQVTTTFPIDETQRKQFKDIVSKATGKSAELVEKVEAELIGGFVLQIGNSLVDESVRGKLRRLKRDLGR
jgi:F-type H+-transporting ATPase subunit delta